MRRLLVLAAMAALAGACVTSEQAQRGPVDATDGLQLSGRVGGHNVSVSDGEPESLLGDCDPPDGRDLDLCIVSHTIDGAPLGLVVENPDALAVGVVLGLRNPRTLGCLPHCDDVTDVAVVELRRGPDRQYVRGGTVTVLQVGQRWAATLRLEFRDGTLNGAFNVEPRVPPEPSPPFAPSPDAPAATGP